MTDRHPYRDAESNGAEPLRTEEEGAPVLVACAMAEEAAPFLEHLDNPRAVPLLPAAKSGEGASGFGSQVEPACWEGTLGGHSAKVVVTGIGLANAAFAATLLLSRFPGRYILAGTCGGLGEGVRVGQVIAGTSAAYLHADATAFGYKLGQVPGMPALYAADTKGCRAGEEVGAHAGLVLSGNSFVTAANVRETREDFPDGLAVDMETAAAAQVCYRFGADWISLRAVSDLCGPRAGEDFHVSIEDASAKSFHAVMQLLARL